MRNIMNVATLAVSAIVASACAIDSGPQNGETELLAMTEQASTIQGCDDGFVCIYPENAGWNNGVPSATYFFYGPANLSNQFNNHYVYNHQTGSAQVWMCNGYNGGDCRFSIPPGAAGNVNLTPVNSIKLTPK